ncbi:MAG: lysophospholipid acyltransferase family protein [Elainellaceae cyanobacterium]
MPKFASQKSAEIRSRISPWLVSVVYPLGCNVLLPAYFGRITISGQEHLPHKGPVILAPTHRSRWDALLVPYAAGRYVTGRDLRFMVTADEMQGIQGWFIRRLGGFPINTRQPGIASLRYGVEVLENKEMMVIFPEGGIFRDRDSHPLKPGLARLAVQTELAQPGIGVQVVPMSLSYSELIPSWGCNVDIRIGEPLTVSDYSSGKETDACGAKQIARRLTQDLQNAIGQLYDGAPDPVATPSPALD